VVEDLTPRLDSAPNVLLSRMPALASGEYMLHWSVKTSAGDGLVQGDIPFSVDKTLSNEGISDRGLDLPLQRGLRVSFRRALSEFKYSN
jgi:hypothetical protein